jgi:hypothetical protein
MIRECCVNGNKKLWLNTWFLSDGLGPGQSDQGFTALGLNHLMDHTPLSFRGDMGAGAVEPKPPRRIGRPANIGCATGTGQPPVDETGCGMSHGAFP